MNTPGTIRRSPAASNRNSLVIKTGLAALLLLSALFLSACMAGSTGKTGTEGENSQTDFPHDNVGDKDSAQKEPDGPIALKFPTERLPGKTGCYSINIEYPFTGTESVDPQLNTWADALNRASIAEFHEICAKGFTKNTLDVRYEAYTAYGVLSLVFSKSMYTGGAHPANEVETMNFRLEDGARLSMEELFAKPDGLWEELADFSRKTLRPRLDYVWSASDVFDSGLQPVRENFQHFALTPEGLMLIFPPYQVAPYSEGTIKVNVPLSQLVRFVPKPGLWQ